MSDRKLLSKSKPTNCDRKKTIEDKTNDKTDQEIIELDHNENTEEYIVEMVADKEVDKEGNALYFVKWEGYGRYENTWEPVQNLVGCDWALRNYQLTRASWLANKYGDKASLKQLLRKQHYAQSMPSSSFHRNVKDSHIPSNAPIGKKQKLKGIKDKTEFTIFPKSAMCGVSSKPKKEWRVIEILGMTEVENEKYFLLSLEDYEERAFIRASLANRLFPNKVIDFYMKNFRWKQEDKQSH